MKSYYVNRILKFEFNEKSSRKRTISDDFFFQEIVFFWSGCCCHNPTPLLACLWDHLGLIDLPSGPLLLSCFNNFSLRKKKKISFQFSSASCEMLNGASVGGLAVGGAWRRPIGDGRVGGTFTKHFGQHRQLKEGLSEVQGRQWRRLVWLQSGTGLWIFDEWQRCWPSISRPEFIFWKKWTEWLREEDETRRPRDADAVGWSGWRRWQVCTLVRRPVGWNEKNSAVSCRVGGPLSTDCHDVIVARSFASSRNGHRSCIRRSIAHDSGGGCFRFCPNRRIRADFVADGRPPIWSTEKCHSFSTKFKWNVFSPGRTHHQMKQPKI